MIFFVKTILVILFYQYNKEISEETVSLLSFKAVVFMQTHYLTEFIHTMNNISDINEIYSNETFIEISNRESFKELNQTMHKIQTNLINNTNFINFHNFNIKGLNLTGFNCKYIISDLSTLDCDYNNIIVYLMSSLTKIIDKSSNSKFSYQDEDLKLFNLNYGNAYLFTLDKLIERINHYYRDDVNLNRNFNKISFFSSLSLMLLFIVKMSVLNKIYSSIHQLNEKFINIPNKISWKYYNQCENFYLKISKINEQRDDNQNDDISFNLKLEENLFQNDFNIKGKSDQNNSNFFKDDTNFKNNSKISLLEKILATIYCFFNVSIYLLVFFVFSDKFKELTFSREIEDKEFYTIKYLDLMIFNNVNYHKNKEISYLGLKNKELVDLLINKQYNYLNENYFYLYGNVTLQKRIKDFLINRSISNICELGFENFLDVLKLENFSEDFMKKVCLSIPNKQQKENMLRSIIFDELGKKYNDITMADKELVNLSNGDIEFIGLSNPSYLKILNIFKLIKQLSLNTLETIEEIDRQELENIKLIILILSLIYIAIILVFEIFILNKDYSIVKISKNMKCLILVMSVDDVKTIKPLAKVVTDEIENSY